MVYIFLADGFEEIEALTVVDVLRRADIEIKMVSVMDKTVTGGHGIMVQADCLIDEINGEDADMFVLPGGMPGTTNLEKNERLQEFLKYAVDNKVWIAAICAAPIILGNKGYLKDMHCICFPGFEKYLQGAVIKDNHVNISGKFITSKGPGTALDFAYTIVSILKDDDTAHRLKVQMQYANHY
ncbi:DJ-1 family glyoxalase III [Petroclostridium sp. X23]|uniref:DJ-1 family glyoxalase III n=1 Tax=Petroclostridium sp. X23 TaxID=3045146 RepID=UPI0024ACE1FF|nr:DJ-1 family glyoxalase III [Petroclostridium sp. X23]WHH60597.1 DJ-1/PfpI family protein [Petroclostridium sp. X23]